MIKAGGQAYGQQDFTFSMLMCCGKVGKETEMDGGKRQKEAEGHNVILGNQYSLHAFCSLYIFNREFYKKYNT